MSHRSAVVIGAGFAGLLTAAAAAQTGARVTVFERDRLSDAPDPRHGVPQGEQPHVLLHRGLRALESLLPGVERDLLDVGGVKINTGRMPWLSPYGWFPVDPPSYEIVSLTRPLLELVVRRRVLADESIDLRQGARVSSLARAGQRWEIQCADGSAAFADLVVDASGRSSRLRHWLDELGVAVPEPATVDAKLGYAARRYRAPAPVPLRSGVVIAASPYTEAGALVLPVENQDWLVGAVGYGSKRPRATRPIPISDNCAIRPSQSWPQSSNRSATWPFTARRATDGMRTATPGAGRSVCWWSAMRCARSTRSTAKASRSPPVRPSSSGLS